jgi:hypothetical protein
MLVEGLVIRSLHYYIQSVFNVKEEAERGWGEAPTHDFIDIHMTTDL